MVNIRAEINEIENRKAIEKNQWNEKLVLEKIKTTDNCLARLTKIRRENTQIINIRNELGISLKILQPFKG